MERVQAWHSRAHTFYHDKQCSLSQTLRALREEGFDVRRHQLRFFLKRRGILRPSNSGWNLIDYEPRKCTHCSNEFKPAARTQRWCKTCCPTPTDGMRMMVYGLTRAQFDALMTRAAGHCEICGEKPQKLNIDHDHRTGEVRGLLCDLCNMALAALDRFPSWPNAAQKYLTMQPPQESR